MLHFLRVVANSQSHPPCCEICSSNQPLWPRPKIRRGPGSSGSSIFYKNTKSGVRLSRLCMRLGLILSIQTVWGLVSLTSSALEHPPFAFIASSSLYRKSVPLRRTAKNRYTEMRHTNARLGTRPTHQPEVQPKLEEKKRAKGGEIIGRSERVPRNIG